MLDYLKPRRTIRVWKKNDLEEQPIYKLQDKNFFFLFPSLFLPRATTRSSPSINFLVEYPLQPITRSDSRYDSYPSFLPYHLLSLDFLQFTFTNRKKAVNKIARLVERTRRTRTQRRRAITELRLIYIGRVKRKLKRSDQRSTRILILGFSASDDFCTILIILFIFCLLDKYKLGIRAESLKHLTKFKDIFFFGRRAGFGRRTK